MMSCSSKPQGTRSMDPLPDSTTIRVKLTPEQGAAFDALNDLQRQMQAQHLYSTFPGISQECLQPDTSYVISRIALLDAMVELLGKYCTDIPIGERNELATNAVLAQETYTIEQCYGNELQMIDGVLHDVQSTASRSGTWVLPKVLGHRDIVLVW